MGLSPAERDRELFDRAAARYARKDRHPASALVRRRQLLAALQLLPDPARLGTVLDIGCGIAAPAGTLLGRYDRYIGIDHAPRMVELARRRHAGNERAEFIAAPVGEASIAAASVDTVLSLGALHHMGDIGPVLAALRRWARPGAALLVIEPHNHNPLLRLLRAARQRLDADYSRDQVFFSVAALQAALAAAGVRVHAVAYQGFLAQPFAEVPLPPAWLTRHLARAALRADGWLERHAARGMRRLSFRVVLCGRFPG